MLKRFSVTNFKNFKTQTSLILDHPCNYGFNEEIIKNSIVTKGIIYGINGSGKSNLALALFDIIFHLTDKEKSPDRYQLYLNLDSNKPTADFEYLFCFNGVDVLYKYSKTDVTTLTHENLKIDGQEVFDFDYNANKGYTTLEGAGTLNLTQVSQNNPSFTSKLSRVKYIASNSLLVDNKINNAFRDFVAFVDNMLMFYSLDSRGYQGLMVGRDSFTKGIIRENKVEEFQKFLSSQNVQYHLVVGEFNGEKELFCKFSKSTVPFMSVASTGTKSLALFYYWFIKMSYSSFVCIDEYDAFYHFELAQSLVELTKSLQNTQIIMSTHNTDLLSNDILRPDAYFVLQNNQIKSLNELTSKDIRRAHNLQKMYKAGSFNE